MFMIEHSRLPRRALAAFWLAILVALNMAAADANAAPKPSNSYVQSLAASYGCPAGTQVVMQSYQGAWGAADPGINTIYISPYISGGILTYTVAHECAHLLQAKVYGGGWGGFNTAMTAMNRIYGGSGYSGVDQNADCLTVRHGLGNQHYTTSCYGARGEAAQQLWNGVRVDQPVAPQFSVRGAIGDAFHAAGGSAGVGRPTSNEICGLKGGGCYQVFERAHIFWSPATGAHVVRGGINARWRAAGAENSGLGFPLMSEQCGRVGGGCWQQFQGGVIFWHPQLDAHVVDGDINRVWRQNAAENGFLGYPMMSQQCGIREGGCWQKFQGGDIFWHPQHGTQVMFGGINTMWRAAGAENGALGYPTSGEYVTAEGVVRDFQHGRIVWTAAQGARIIR